MTEQAGAYYKYLVLGEFILSFLCNIFSIFNCSIILIYFYKVFRKKEWRPKVSAFFFALLVNYLLAALFLLPYDIFVLANWRPYASFRNGPMLFWVSVMGHCLIATNPLSVFFLTLDRI
uniref:G-protein coupled receptors family 1 profile domain-containing protein n=1 Tax=Ditylenchus dipsaci TaxID=166011 RepID=A0A915DKQ8_9BILA